MARPGRQPGEPSLRLLRFWYRFTAIWTLLWGVLTIAVLVAAIPEWTGITPVPAEDIEGGIYAAVISVIMTGVGWLPAWLAKCALVARERSLPQPPSISTLAGRFQVEKRHKLPRPESAARQPVRLLGEAEDALEELLGQLSEVVPAHVVEHTWQVATDTAIRLRAVAARLEAVELAAAHAPVPKQADLEKGAGELREHLDVGLGAYRNLIAVAGQVLFASTTDMATDDLVEATDTLAGLADALHELYEQGTDHSPEPGAR